MNIELLHIQKIVENHVGFRITKQTRKRHVVDARRIYFRLSREFTKYSLASIGFSMDKDHATALHGIKTCKDLCKTDKEFKRKYLILRNQLMQINSLEFKKTIFSPPRAVHPGRFLKLNYGKSKSIRQVFDKGGQAAKQRCKLYQNDLPKYIRDPRS